MCIKYSCHISMALCSEYGMHLSPCLVIECLVLQQHCLANYGKGVEKWDHCCKKSRSLGYDFGD